MHDEDVFGRWEVLARGYREVRAPAALVGRVVRGVEVPRRVVPVLPWASAAVAAACLLALVLLVPGAPPDQAGSAPPPLYPRFADLEESALWFEVPDEVVDSPDLSVLSGLSLLPDLSGLKALEPEPVPVPEPQEGAGLQPAATRQGVPT